MNIATALSAGQSKTTTQRIVDYIGEDKARLRELMDLFLKGDHCMVQRAAWPLGDLAVIHPPLFRPYYAVLIKKLENPGPDRHPAVARNILRVFERTEIPEKYCGRMIDIAFAFIRDEKAPIAIRAYAVTIASNICRQYPDLHNELRLLLQELSQLPQPPAIRHRVKLALKAASSARSQH